MAKYRILTKPAFYQERKKGIFGGNITWSLSIVFAY